MSVYHVVETGVVATVVASNVSSLTGRHVPAMRTHTMARAASWYDRPLRPGWTRVLEQRLSVPGALFSCHSDPLLGSICRSGRSGCASGGSTLATLVEQPIHFV